MGFQQGLSGLNASSKSLEAIGNNVANSGTVGFKSATAQFSDVFAASLAGGGNGQIGIGASLSSVAQQFTQGNITSTSNSLDLAINGAGMFRLSNNGAITYSRNGQFELDKNGYVVNSSGLHVTGYTADVNGNIVPGNISDLQVLSTNIAPKVTSTSQIQFNLDSRAKVPAAMTSGTLTGNVTLTDTTNITSSNNILQLSVDGITANITLATGSYSRSTLAETLQKQINLALGNSGASVTVDLDTSNKLRIKSTSAGTVGSQGSGSSVVLLGGSAVPEILSTSTHGTLTGTLAAPLVFPLQVNTGSTLSMQVDGGALVTTIDLGGATTFNTYNDAQSLTTAVQNAINTALTTNGQAAQVVVTMGVGGQLTITSNSTGTASKITGFVDTVATPLFGAAPTAIAGATGPTSSTAGFLTASNVLGTASGAVQGAVVGGVLVPVTITATNDVLTFNVDTPAVPTTITIPAGTYNTLSDLAAAMQGGAVPANVYVSVVGNQLKITSKTAGTSSSVTGIGGDAAAVSSFIGATPTYTPGGYSSIVITQGVNDTLQLMVDGVAANITLTPGSYSASDLAGNPTATPPVVGILETAINKALGTTGKAVTVNLSATGRLVIKPTSSAGSDSGVTLTGGTAATTLLGVSPVVTVGTGPTWVKGGDNFSVTNAQSYTSSTSQTVYDSLGNPHNLQPYFVKTSEGNRWQMYTTLDGGNLMGPIDLQFSTAGVLTTAMPLTQSYTLTNGATSPLTYTLDLTGSTQYGVSFGVNKLYQDGYTSGRLSSMSVSEDGVILGRYSNGESRNMGQLVLVKFNNQNGLQSLGNNQWAETSESGQPIPGTPGQGSLGKIQAAAVEESNVDLTAELVNMITQQRAYQANAQTIKTMDQILQTLVNLR